jgi:hypothetical protein
MDGASDPPLFAAARYAELAARLAPSYATAAPFPHAVIDDFLPAEAAERVLAEFPRPGDLDWTRFQDASGRKLASGRELQLPPGARGLLRELNSALFLDFLERLTGIEGLIPDPSLEGGGLHQIEPGGFLKIHADFNLHPRLRLDRRLNLLLYLNKDWKEEYGGHLQLWDRGMTRCERKLLPVFNRCVVFSTTDWSFHGHPEPLTCPEGMTRKSLALYYYTNGRPEAERSAEHTTLYQYRPGEAGPLRRASRGLRRFLFRVFSKLAELFRPPSY